MNPKFGEHKWHLALNWDNDVKHKKIYSSVGTWCSMRVVIYKLVVVWAAGRRNRPQVLLKSHAHRTSSVLSDGYSKSKDWLKVTIVKYSQARWLVLRMFVWFYIGQQFDIKVGRGSYFLWFCAITVFGWTRPANLNEYFVITVAIGQSPMRSNVRIPLPVFCFYFRVYQPVWK